MLNYAVICFVIALAASLLGLSGVAGLWAELTSIFTVTAVVLLVVAAIGGRTARPVSIP